jgi:membrane fusion protein (multidrug efflux system)
VKIDTPADQPQLRAGMSVTLDVDTGHERGLPSFISGAFGKSAK